MSRVTSPALATDNRSRGTQTARSGANCTTTRICSGATNPSIFDFSNSETLFGWTLGVGMRQRCRQPMLLSNGGNVRYEPE
jgi:hypothetical protein